MSKLPFQDLPPMVRNAIGLVAVAWISLMAFVYHVHRAFPGVIGANHAIRAAIAGAVICYFVFRIKPWARSLCIYFNLALIGINALFLYIRLTTLGLESFALSLHALVNCLLFAASTYYLIAKQTASFYRERLPKLPQTNNSKSDSRQS